MISGPSFDRKFLREIRDAIWISPRSFAIAITFSFLQAILEGVMIGLVYLLASPADSVRVVTRVAAKFPTFLSVPSPISEVHALVVTGFVSLVVLAFRVWVGFLRQLGTQRVLQRVAADFGERILVHLVDSPPSVFHRWNRERLFHMITQQAAECGMLMQYILQGISGFVSLALLLAGAVYFSWALTLMGAGIGLGIMFMNRVSFQRAMVLGEKKLETFQRLTALTQDTLHGFDVIKLEGMEADVKERVHGENLKALGIRTDRAHLVALTETLSDSVMHVAMVVLVFTCTVFHLVSHAGLLAYILLFQRLQLTVRSFQSLWLSIQDMRPSWNEIHKLIETRWPVPPAPSRPAMTPDLTTGCAIHIQNLSFRYSTETTFVLEKLDLTIAPGERVLIRGRSGTGKSTLVHLLAGFLEPIEGQIAIDGIPLTTASFTDLRERMSHCAPNSYLFRESLRYNVTLGKNISDEQVVEALERAGARELIQGTFGGLDAPVAQNGENLSLGQRQRVMLARMFLKRPRLVLLDEATCNLDLALEGVILKNLVENLPQATIVMVTHRAPDDFVFARVLELQGRRLQDSA